MSAVGASPVITPHPQVALNAIKPETFNDVDSVYRLISEHGSNNGPINNKKLQTFVETYQQKISIAVDDKTGKIIISFNLPLSSLDTCQAPEDTTSFGTAHNYLKDQAKTDKIAEIIKLLGQGTTLNAVLINGQIEITNTAATATTNPINQAANTNPNNQQNPNSSTAQPQQPNTTTVNSTNITPKTKDEEEVEQVLIKNGPDKNNRNTTKTVTPATTTNVNSGSSDFHEIDESEALVINETITSSILNNDSDAIEVSSTNSNSPQSNKIDVFEDVAIDETGISPDSNHDSDDIAVDSTHSGSSESSETRQLVTNTSTSSSASKVASASSSPKTEYRDRGKFKQFTSGIKDFFRIGNNKVTQIGELDGKGDFMLSEIKSNKNSTTSDVNSNQNSEETTVQ